MNDPHLTSQSRTDSARCGAALARHRPRYHFLPPSGWMNDPNGLIQWEGRYHLFYQYSPEFGDVPPSHRTATLKHWGHAVSDDLVHWEHWPVALTPTPGGPDKDGCYSGCAVDNDGVPTLVYTGVFPQCACIATSTDGLVTWTNHPANPVVAAPPAGLAVPGFRDHSVWSEADGWHQVIGSGIRGVGGTALHYTSPDLIHWRYRGQLLMGDAELTGAMWECPDFFPLGNQHVLMVSAHPGATAVVYCVGPYAAGTYDGVYRGRVDLGTCFYAPQSMDEDGDARAAPQIPIESCGSGTPQGRRLMWGWLREGRPSAAQQAAGWSGALSLPRVLDLDAAGRLWSAPAPELTALRRRRHTFASLDLNGDRSHPLPGVTGAALEIVAEFAPSATGKVGLGVYCSPDGAEQTQVTYNFVNDRLELDCQRSSRDLTTDRGVSGGPLFRDANAPLRLHVFLDGSVIEVFANGRAAATRAYPTRSDSVGVTVFGCEPRGSECYDVPADLRLTSLAAWEMGAIWDGTETIPERL